MQEIKKEIKGERKKRSISDRAFWRIVTQIKNKSFSFNFEYKKWLWKKPERKRYIAEMYRKGWNQIEIASLLLISPLKIRKTLKSLRKSLEWNIKVNKLLEE